ncbi:hypothetical protein PHMEG_00016928 [Phytophthora megakarya]|uniref:MULE transposase domain-containing protein n=1 Tax=Phytophthora megakarya TaxID=4795 RepID=A0A225VZL9_9STRA|nr:hypothetical protein PHMEG_00016928 [Phytophthora megakarya]
MQRICPELCFPTVSENKRNGIENAKYACKKLYGQQVFDKEVSLEDVVCPFLFNACGIEGFWKVTRGKCCHNHVRQVGFSSRPVAEGTIPRPLKDMRNNTQNLLEIRRLIEVEMLPMYEGKTERMTGVVISDFVIGRGFKLSASAISLIKLTMEAANATERLTSYQKLELLELNGGENPRNARESLGELECFTALCDRQKGLLAAVAEVFTRAGHRFCLRHIKSNINSKGITLTGKERGLINDMARNDCENDYKLYEKKLANIFKVSTKSTALNLDIKKFSSYPPMMKLPRILPNRQTIGLEMIAEALNHSKLLLCISENSLAAHWLTKTPGTDLVPLLASERKKLVVASDMCKTTSCMDGAYNVMFLGKVKIPGHIHPWRLVDLSARECTCGNWQDRAWNLFTTRNECPFTI